MKKDNKGVGFYLIIVLILVSILTLFSQTMQPKRVTYSDVYDYFKTEQVEAFDIAGQKLMLKLKDGKIVKYNVTNSIAFQMDFGTMVLDQYNEGIITEFDYRAEQGSWFTFFLPYLLLFGMIGLFWYFTSKKSDGSGSGGGRSGGMGFGRSRAKLVPDEQKKVTFKDVAGADEEKAELEEIVEFLKDSEKFKKLGARIPKGVLLVGPPGTGKTLLARSIAGEAGTAFFTVSGSDFAELYVGVGASRVRDLFEQAKKHAPSIVFIDEIDAVGRQRGTGVGGGNDEREQTLNQLLVEMDGFGENAGVIIIAATNRADVLDPAILRPGRFDRQVYVGYPDIKGREDILIVHTKNKPLHEDVDLADIAKGTVGFTGADLENLLNEAALLAAKHNRASIETEDIEMSFLKVIMGTEKKNRVISEKDKKLTAYHEAGHAVITKLLTTQDPVHRVSIIPRGSAGGFTLHRPQEDKQYSSKTEMLDSLLVYLAGRVAEKIVMDDISTGASNDIERLTAIATNMVTRYGMSDKIGPINYGKDQNEVFLGRDFYRSNKLSETTSSEIDGEIRDIIQSAYAKCEQMLRDNIDKLTNVAEYLIRNEVIDGDVFIRLFNGENVPDVTLKKAEKKINIEKISSAENIAPASEGATNADETNANKDK